MKARDTYAEANPAKVNMASPENGPNSREFDDLVAENFASYRLRVSGVIEAPCDFSLADLKAMPKQEQITTHFCIQGWSGVAEWGGVPMRDILDLVRPTPEARYAVFYSLADGADGGRYYDVHKVENMRHELTILAYEMNGGQSASCMGRRCGCAARTSWVSRWSIGSPLSSSSMVSPISAPARAATTRTTNSTATGCRFDRLLQWLFPGESTSMAKELIRPIDADSAHAIEEAQYGLDDHRPGSCFALVANGACIRRPRAPPMLWLGYG